jgi:FtsP/CotA-like multicopper oxidase with cupredoxin domain
MRARLERRLPYTGVLAVIVALAATVGALGANSSSSRNPAAAANSGVLVAGGARTVQPAQSARPVHASPAVFMLAPPGGSRAAVSPTPLAASANDPVYDLCAKAGSVTMPDGVAVPIWGFATKPSGVECTDPSVVAGLPGPQLDVTVGDDVTLNVTNALDRQIEIEAPGVNFAAGDGRVDPGATGTLTFTANAGSSDPLPTSAGTYLYESAGDAGRQEAMGLYGALVVHPATNSEYGHSFDVERTLVLSEIDAGLNATPDTFDMNTWKPTYWLINGKAYPDTAAIAVPAGQTLLLRYANAGIDNNTLTMLGLRQTVIGCDQFALADPFNVVAQVFPSGGTADAIVETAGDASHAAVMPGAYPLYSRNLNLRNGAFGGPSYNPGGMLTIINVT